MKKIILSVAVILIMAACKKSSAPALVINNNSIDADIINPGITGTEGTIIIGTQTWQKKNLNVSHYRNGDSIPQVQDADAWAALTTGAWCYYNNDSATGATYGKLYNSYAVNDPRGLAPKGWHIPSEAEWTTLSDFLGGIGLAGGRMKETGLKHWFRPNVNATNTSGFKAKPGGNRDIKGNFGGNRLLGYWWSNTDRGPLAYSIILLRYNSGMLDFGDGFIREGCSVRCVKN